MEASTSGLEFPEKVKEEPEDVESKHNDQNEEQSFKDEKPVPNLRIQYTTRSKVLDAKPTLQYRGLSRRSYGQDSRCEVCGASYRSRTSLNYHIRTKHPGHAESKPTVKVKKEPSDDSLLVEIEPVKKPLFQCQICNKVLFSKANLQNHEATHMDKAFRQNYRCKICGATYTSSTGLMYHLRTKHAKGRKKLPCPICERVYKSVVGRRTHMIAKHGEGGPVLKCKKCPKVFAYKRDLDLHMATHGFGPFGLHICRLCGKPYAKASNLAKHEATCAVMSPVQPIKTFHCGQCSEVFAIAVMLRIHEMTTHGGTIRAKKKASAEKSKTRMKRRVVFQCEYCPRRFVSKQGYLKHGKRQHMEAFGYAVPLPESQREIVNFVKAEKLPDEADMEQEVNPVEGSVFCEYDEYAVEELSGDVQFDTEEEEKCGTIDPVENIASCETLDIEETFIPAVELLEGVKAEPDEDGENITSGPVENVAFCEASYVKDESTLIDGNEINVKKEFIELGEYQVADFKNDCSDNLVYDIKVENIVVESDQPENQTVEQDSKETPIPIRNPAKKMVSQDLRCDQCDKTYHFEINLKIHKAKAHGIGEKPTRKASTVITRSCRHCKKTFNDWTRLVRHLKYVHAETVDQSKLHRCTSCKAYFMCAEEMEHHVCLKKFPVDLERPFKCDLCGKGFSKRFQMVHHYNSHPEYQNVKCDQCPKAFFDESQLNCHKTKKHKQKDDCFKCKICKKLLASQENLKLHLEHHAADKVACTCEQCGRQYESRKSLMHHIYSKHKAEPDQAEPNRCSICGKMFSSKQSLKGHMKTHDLQIKCTFCEKLFSANYQRIIHEQSHTKD